MFNIGIFVVVAHSMHIINGRKITPGKLWKNVSVNVVGVTSLVTLCLKQVHVYRSFLNFDYNFFNQVQEYKNLCLFKDTPRIPVDIKSFLDTMYVNM